MCELKIKKIKKMIKKVLSGKIELPIEAFKDLCNVYDNLVMLKESFIETENIENKYVEIKPIEIKSLNPPKTVKNVIKIKIVINMKEVISELESNKLFLKRKDLCKDL